jgi:hypothetical protein
MMGGVSPETCWASYKYEVKFWYTVASCWIFFVNYTMMHGSTNIKLMCTSCVICYHPIQTAEMFHTIWMFLIYHNLYWGWLPWDSHYLVFFSKIYWGRRISWKSNNVIVFPFAFPSQHSSRSCPSCHYGCYMTMKSLERHLFLVSRRYWWLCCQHQEIYIWMRFNKMLFQESQQKLQQLVCQLI